MPRKYEKVQELLPVVKQLQGEGYTQREIAVRLGLENKEVVKNLLWRQVNTMNNSKPGLFNHGTAGSTI